MTPSQQKALDELMPQVGIAYSAKPLDLHKNFGRAASVVFEIGFGNGETLVQQAKENPGQDYLGIEVHEPGIGHCLLMAREAGISNLRLIAHDAIEVLEQQIPLDSLQRINLYFPDPWPKKRHHKRRIVQPAFLDKVARALRPGGMLHMATDWVPYAEHMAEMTDGCEWFEKDGGTGTPQAFAGRPQTKFERRGMRLGHEVRDLLYRRNDAPLSSPADC